MSKREKKEINAGWESKFHPYYAPMDLYYWLEIADDALLDIQQIIENAGLGSLNYKSQKEKAVGRAKQTGVLNEYILTLREEVRNKLDTPLYRGFDQGGTEYLNRLYTKYEGLRKELIIDDNLEPGSIERGVGEKALREKPEYSAEDSLSATLILSCVAGVTVSVKECKYVFKNKAGKELLAIGAEEVDKHSLSIGKCFI